MSVFESRTAVRGLRLERCLFDVHEFGCDWPPEQAPWSVRDVEVIDCTTQWSTRLWGGVLDEVVVDRLEGPTVWLIGCVFRHVLLRGRCNSFVIRKTNAGGPPRLAAIDAVEAETYGSVDWALDVSALQARDVELLGVPARLVRRDPATQVVATAERVRQTQAVWRHAAFENDPWPTLLDRMLSLGVPDQVLVTATRGRSKTRDLQSLRTLQREGVLEPD